MDTAAGDPAALIITRMSVLALAARYRGSKAKGPETSAPGAYGLVKAQAPEDRSRGQVCFLHVRTKSDRTAIQQLLHTECHHLRPPTAAAKQRVDGIVDPGIGSVPVEADLADRKLAGTHDEQVASSRRELRSKPLPMRLQVNLIRVDCLPPHLRVIRPAEIQQHVVGSRRPQAKKLDGRWIEILGEPKGAEAVHRQLATVR